MVLNKVVVFQNGLDNHLVSLVFGSLISELSFQVLYFSDAVDGVARHGRW